MENIDNPSVTGSNAPAPLMTLDQVEERILQLVSQGNADSYQLGQLYNYVVDKNLARVAGFKDAPDFFKQRIKVLTAEPA